MSKLAFVLTFPFISKGFYLPRNAITSIVSGGVVVLLLRLLVTVFLCHTNLALLFSHLLFGFVFSRLFFSFHCVVSVLVCDRVNVCWVMGWEIFHSW